MVTLTLTLGIPASGKTTHARHLAITTGAQHLSTDPLRTHRNIHRATFLAELERRARDALIRGQPVVIDACSTTTHQRARWLALAQHANATPHLIVIHCNLDLALARNATRTNPVPARAMSTYAHEMRRALARIRTEGWAHIEHRGSADTSTMQPIEASEW